MESKLEKVIRICRGTGQGCPWTGTRNKFQPEFAFFLEPEQFELSFHLPEQEFLNLRLILFMKVFLQLIAQFSSNLFAACAITINAVNKFAFACQFRPHVRTVLQKTKRTEVVFDKGKSSYLK